MKSAHLGIFLMVSIYLGGIASAGSKPLAQLTGRFIYKGEGPKAAIVEITVESEANGRFAVGMSAAHPDGHGAAPDGGGEGRVGADGVLRFLFKDSFLNRGKGTFQRIRPNHYRLVIDIDDVQDSRCMVFYGDRMMQRSKP